MTAIEHMKALYLEYDRIKSPNFPEYARCFPNCFSKLSETNGLTQGIICYIKLHGWFAERITSSGRVIDNRETYVDVVGFVKQVGSKNYIPGTSQRGTADISAIIAGRSVRIEVKNSKTKDRKSPAQKGYEVATNITGGIYYVASDFKSFTEWFDSKFHENPERLNVYKRFIESKIII